MVPGIGKEFMEGTKYENMGMSDQRRGVRQPPLETPYDPSGAVTPLPRPTLKRDVTLREAIEGRRSVREYSDDDLTLEELSWLLWSTQGVREVAGARATLRCVPSAGARHAFETYILVNRVEGLNPGIYRYIASKHSLLEHAVDEGLAPKVEAACLGQRTVSTSAVTFIWVAVPHRMTWRYDERGYRYLHLDAGHVCQNLYLAAEAVDGGVCAIGAYNDGELNCVLGIDGEEQFAIYVAAMGKKK